MNGKVDVRIEFVEWKNSTEEEQLEHGQFLDKLRNDLINELEINCEAEKSPPPKNTQDGGLTIAISLASLSLSLIVTLLEIVKFCSERIGRYDIAVTIGDVGMYTMKNIPDDEIVNILQKIKELKCEDVKIHIIERK